MIVPMLAVSVRRLHDVGKPWKMLFISLIPLVGFIWLFYLYCKDGDQNKNEWGERPLVLEVSKTDIIFNHIFVILFFMCISFIYFSRIQSDVQRLDRAS